MVCNQDETSPKHNADGWPIKEMLLLLLITTALQTKHSLRVKILKRRIRVVFTWADDMDM